ncbi:MAG: 50S ribosomal protein L25 [Flavobacteriales bacterium]|nr:50S ribosomal protein L25 [Flavobacteriales bacterium]
MKKVSLSGSLREGVGKKDAKELRANGRVPAVLYGGDTQTHFHVSSIELDKIVYSPDVFQIELDINGKKTKAIIKDSQFHPVTDNYVHIDFLELFDDREVVIKLPVRTVGNSVGVIAGGAKIMNFRKLAVRGLPGDMPDDIVLNVAKMKIGDAIRVRDISVEGCTIVQAPSDVVVAIKTTRAAMSAAAASASGGDEEETEEASEEAAAE